MGCQVFEFNKMGLFLKKLVEFGEGMPRVIHRFIHSLKISPGLWIKLSTGLSTGLWIKLSTGFSTELSTGLWITLSTTLFTVSYD